MRGYKRPQYRVGLPATTAPNRFQREFTVELPDQVWVTDTTYIRAHEGWLYLTAVIDLYSRMVVGWSMNSTMATELVLDALTMAVWRRYPKAPEWFIPTREVSLAVATSPAGARTTT